MASLSTFWLKSGRPPREPRGGAIPVRSAGLVLFRQSRGVLEVFLVHPGGPFWAKKNLGSWSIPKGEYVEGEDPLEAARREFEEETGQPIEGEFLPLGEVKQAGGKVVKAWAVEGDIDPSTLRSNTFTMEWPPRSGNSREFPEVDRAEWFTLDAARAKILPGQLRLLEDLASRITTSGD